MFKANKFIPLSYPITESMPLYGTTPHPTIEKYSSIKEGDTANTSIITIHSHTGTHIDFPNHFLEDGSTSSDYCTEDFIYDNPVIVNIPLSQGELVQQEHLESFADELNKADLLLIKTGFSKFRNREVYRTHNPGIHSNAIRMIRLKFKNLRAIGIDCISISSHLQREEGRKAHKEAFNVKNSYGKPLLLIEDIFLNEDLDELKRVFVMPINIPNMDGLPCTVIGELTQDH